MCIFVQATLVCVIAQATLVVHIYTILSGCVYLEKLPWFCTFEQATFVEYI